MVDFVIAPSCFTDGCTQHCCMRCGYFTTESPTPAIGHHTEEQDEAIAPTCTEDGRTAGSHCSVCGEVLTACDVIPATGHKEGNWITQKTATERADGMRLTKCTVCGEIVRQEVVHATGTIGLSYSLLSDGTYAVSGGKARNYYIIYIPAYHDGRAVTQIEQDAFQACKGLGQVILPDTIVKIGDRAFANCSALNYINFPASLKTIGAYAFSNCSKLYVTAPATVTSVGKDAFRGCGTGQEEMIIPTFFHAEAWHQYAFTDDGMHVLLATSYKTASFFSANDRLGENPVNKFTTAWESGKTDTVSVNDELFLSRFECCLYDYAYHIIYLDFPNDIHDTRANYLAGLKKMIDLCHKIRPNTPVVYVNTAVAEEADVRALFEKNGCKYWNYYRGKPGDFLAAHEQLAQATPYAKFTKFAENEIPYGQIDKYKEGVSFDITEVMQPTKQKTDLPRVLIVGDSICYGYRDEVRRQMEGTALVDSYVISFAVADPAILRGLTYLVQHYDYDVIHINIAFHNCYYDMQPGGYAKYLESLLRSLQKLAPNAKIVFATGTNEAAQDGSGKLIWQNGKNVIADKTNGIWKERRDAAISVCQKLGITVNDLWLYCKNNNPAHADNLHFADSANPALAAEVVKYLRSGLK